MSDLNVLTKLSEQLIDVIKKFNIFEKTVEIKKSAYGIFLFTTIMTVTVIVNGIYTDYKINVLTNEVFDIENKIIILDKKLDKVLENNKQVYKILEENNVLLKKCIENQFLYICNLNNTEVEKFNNELTNNIKEDKKEKGEKEEKKEEYNELLDECYDIIPCNNSKKITGFNKFLNWT